MNKEFIRFWRVCGSGRKILRTSTLNMVCKNLILNTMHCTKCLDPNSEQIRIAANSALPSVTRSCRREEWCEISHKIRNISIPFTESEKSHMSPEKGSFDFSLSHFNPRFVLPNTTPCWLIIVSRIFLFQYSGQSGNIIGCFFCDNRKGGSGNLLWNPINKLHFPEDGNLREEKNLVKTSNYTSPINVFASSSVNVFNL